MGFTVYLIFSFVLALAVYILPSVIAMRKNHSKESAILALNVLAGWTVIGWIACFIWAMYDPQLDSRAIPENWQRPASQAKPQNFTFN